MGLLAWFRFERAWAKALGKSAYFSRKAVAPGVASMGGDYGPLFYRPVGSDLHTFWQVFKNKEYDFSGVPQHKTVDRAYEAALAAGKTPVIIDAGANIGAASVWFSRRFPKARVIAIEPDPQNARICRMNAEGRNFEVVEAAIGATAGSVSLLAEDDQGSWGIRTIPGGDIPVVTVPELVARVPNPALLLVKVDIEGFESDLFSAGTDWLHHTTALFVEPHDWMLPGQGSSHSFRSAIGPEFDMLIAGENLLFIRNENQATAAQQVADAA